MRTGRLLQKPLMYRLLAIGILCIFFPVTAFSSDELLRGPGNWGGTGLMEIPSARVMPLDSCRIGVAQSDPYRWYYGAMSLLPGLEIGGRVTETLGVKDQDPKWSGYGNTKDKAFDLKYQLITEGKYRPAVALGIMDPHGTRKFASQYVAFSKEIYPFDFTVGMGNGRFGEKPLPSQGEGVKLEIFEDPKTWLSDAKIFWGIEFSPSEKLSMMLEYSPIEYHLQTSDSAQPRYFREAVPSKFNFGVRWRPVSWAEIDVTYQRGEQFGAGISTQFDIGNPVVPIYDAPCRERPADKILSCSERIGKALSVSGFSSIGVRAEGDDLWIEAENDKYFHTPRAWGGDSRYY
ncbi:MAG: YjbH domain-containing protein [Pseudomonadota bacterium]